MKVRVRQDWRERYIEYLKKEYGSNWRYFWYNIQKNTKFMEVLDKLAERGDILEAKREGTPDLIYIKYPEDLMYDKKIVGAVVPIDILEVIKE